MKVIGYLDKEKYSCMSEHLITNEVIITEERIQHIQERHPGDFERYVSYLKQIIEDPDYILEANKPNTAVLLKEFEQQEERFKMILRIRVESDPVGYKNSVLSFWYIGETTWRKTLKHKKILYSGR